jgi:NAD(P)-dependent dehydrogenase (short-subunit alcohol dehydrogenase family)
MREAVEAFPQKRGAEMADVFGLTGKPVLVVGGGSGIGEATAELLAQVGAKVAVADVDPERARQVATAVGGHAISGDVTTPDGAQRVVDEAHTALGGLYGVANIVGLAGWNDLFATDLDVWEADMRINLLHHLFIGRAAARHMVDDKSGGAFAMVASVSGLYGAPMHSAYGMAKAGTMSLARSMTNEWSKYGIRANCVAPDCIATPRVVAGFHNQGITDIDAVAAADGVPLARWGTPREIAGPLVFLLSSLSSFMTGQTLVADGGTQARFPHQGNSFDEPETD